jgi:hypothetical protein
MVQQTPDPSADSAAEQRQLSGGAIASLTGVGLLAIFMIQNREDVTLDSCSGASYGRCGCSPSRRH